MFGSNPNRWCCALATTIVLKMDGIACGRVCAHYAPHPLRWRAGGRLLRRRGATCSIASKPLCANSSPPLRLACWLATFRQHRSHPLVPIWLVACPPTSFFRFSLAFFFPLALGAFALGFGAPPDLIFILFCFFPLMRFRGPDPGISG